jgi:hypothetical protein
MMEPPLPATPEGACPMNVPADPNDELPAIAGVYVDTDRYRRLVEQERQVRALLNALHRTQQPDQILEALRLAISENDDALESLDPNRWELYQTLSALIESSGWKVSP